MSKRRPPQAPDRTPGGQFAPGRSGNPRGRSARVDARRSFRSDDWQNFFTGVGVFGKDKRVGTHFNLHQLSFEQLKDLWLGDDLAARAVETIPREALRQGYDIIISSAQDQLASKGSGMDPAELAAEVTQKLDVLGADEYLEVAGSYERGYGGGAILIGANDGQEDMTRPLNLNKVRSIDWLTPLEARELMPLYAYSDPRAPKYGQPEIYQLTSRSVLPSYSGNYQSSTMLIHESRLIIFPGIRVSRYQVTTARGGWGESVLSRVYRVLRDFNQAWGSAGVLVTDFAQSVIKITGLWEALALDGNQAFANRLAAMEYGRSVVNALTIDAGDDYSRQQTPLTGLPDLLEKFAVRLAAACDMPLTLLFGTSPAGMNATGESDVRFFYDRVASYQTRKMEPALRRLCQIIYRTIGNRQEPEKWNVKFRPLWQDSAKDKAGAMLTQAQADSAWISAGVLSAEEVAAAHWGKGEYDPNITVDFEAREAQEAATSAPVDQQALNAMDPDHYSYQPPPEPGTAEVPGEVPPPGEPAAPDPNTKPVSIVQTEDSAGARRRDHAVLSTEELVTRQLEDDFPPESLDWITSAHWEGPTLVPTDEIDYSNESNWRAHHEPKKVAKFKKRIEGGWMKPIILVKRPSSDKLMIVDGHHRALAYREAGAPAMAYIAHVPTDVGPWDQFHLAQHEAEDIREDAAQAVRMDYIRRRGGQYYVYSEKTNKQLAGPLATRGEAVKRLGQIEYFKHRSDADQERERDERGRFAGGGYGGAPSPAQAVARAGHERMAAEHAAGVAYHAARARDLHARAEVHAKTGDWMKFADSSRKAVEHKGKAAQAMLKVTYHAERAGTTGARAHVANATAELARRDAWSEEAREAAIEARRANAKGKEQTIAKGKAALAAGTKTPDARHSKKVDPTKKAADPAAKGKGPGHPVPPPGKPVPSAAGKTEVAKAMSKGAEAHAASQKARETDKPEDHAKAAEAHEAASKAFEKAGPEHAELATHHAARAAEHGVHVKGEGEHGEGHGEKGKGEHGKGEHGKGEHGKGGGAAEKLKGALEFTKAGAEIVGGKAAGEAAEGIGPEIEGGKPEGKKEKE